MSALQAMLAMMALPAAIVLAQAPPSPVGAWTQPGGASWHGHISRHAPPSLTLPTWTRATSLSGSPLTFAWQSGVCVGEKCVYALCMVQGVHTLIAFDRCDGSIRWERPLPALPSLQSQSWPVLDMQHETVLCSAGTLLVAINMHTGSVRWQTQLAQPIVNASPIVTDDLARANRVFITDFALSAQSRLYCINASPFDAALNPHLPGEIVWSVEIGSASGATPAYLPRRLGGLGHVYVTSYADDENPQRGSVMAFDARATSAQLLWRTHNPIDEGFFSGVCVVPRGTHQQPELLASAYAFAGISACAGGLASANVLRLDARTGAVLASVPANRASSMPIQTLDGRVLLSSGVQGFGSAISLSLFSGAMTSAWSTALSTWNDTNTNCFIDLNEYTPIGGYVQQPAVCVDRGRSRIITGTMAANSLASPGTVLRVIDPDLSPVSPGFIVTSSACAGSSPTPAGANVYAFGTCGLAAFGPPPCAFDTDASQRFTLDDLYAFEQGSGSRDVNGDGAVDSLDRDALHTLARASEPIALGQQLWVQP